MAKMQPVARIVVRKLRLTEQLLFGSNPGISTVASVSRSRSQCQEGEITSLFVRQHIIADKAKADATTPLGISSQTVETINQTSAAPQVHLDYLRAYHAGRVPVSLND